MNKIIALLFALSFQALGNAASIQTQITTQMYEDGKPDTDRLFIFYFDFLDRVSNKEQWCEVISITVNNKNCGSQSMGGNGFWLKPEYSNKDTNGKDNFICKHRKVSKESSELVIVDKSIDYQITHRLLFNVTTRQLLDYKGQLTKTSFITNKIETAEYKPFIAKSSFSDGWSAVDMGCSKMSSPVIVPETKPSK